MTSRQNHVSNRIRRNTGYPITEIRTNDRRQVYIFEKNLSKKKTKIITWNGNYLTDDESLRSVFLQVSLEVFVNFFVNNRTWELIKNITCNLVGSEGEERRTFEYINIKKPGRKKFLLETNMKSCFISIHLFF